MIYACVSLLGLHRFKLGWLAALFFLLWGDVLLAQTLNSLSGLIEVKETDSIQFTLKDNSYHATIHVRPGTKLQASFKFVVMMAEQANSRDPAIDLGKGEVLKGEGFKEISLTFSKDASLPKTPHLFIRSDLLTWRDTIRLAMTLPAAAPQKPTLTLKIQSVNNHPVTDGTVNLSTSPDTATLTVLITWDGLTETLKAIVELQGATGRPLNSQETPLSVPQGQTTVTLVADQLSKEVTGGLATLTARIASVGKWDGTPLSQPLSLPTAATVTLILPPSAPADKRLWLWVAVLLLLLAGVGIWQRHQVLGSRCPQCGRVYRGWNPPAMCENTALHEACEVVPLFRVEVDAARLTWNLNQQVKQTITLSNCSVRPIQVEVKSRASRLLILHKGKSSQFVKVRLGVAQRIQLPIEGNLSGISNRDSVMTVAIVRPRVDVPPMTLGAVSAREDATPPQTPQVPPLRVEKDVILPSEIELEGEVPTPFTITNPNQQESITVQLTKPDWVEVPGLPLELQPRETRACVVWANKKANAYTKVMEDKLGWQIDGKPSKSTQLKYIPALLADAVCPECKKFYSDLAEIPEQCTNTRCNQLLLSVQIDPSSIDFNAESGFAPKKVTLVNKSIVPVKVQLNLDENSLPWLLVISPSPYEPFKLAKDEGKKIFVWVDNEKAAVTSESSLEGHLIVSAVDGRFNKKECLVKCQPQRKTSEEQWKETIQSDLKNIKEQTNLLLEILDKKPGSQLTPAPTPSIPGDQPPINEEPKKVPPQGDPVYSDATSAKPEEAETPAPPPAVPPSGLPAIRAAVDALKNPLASETDLLRQGQRLYDEIQNAKEGLSPKEPDFQELDALWAEAKQVFQAKGIRVIDQVDRPYEEFKHWDFGGKGKTIAKILKVGYHYLAWRDPKATVIEKARVHLKE